MRYSVSQYLQGYLKIQITGSSRARFLNLCAYHGIRLNGIQFIPDGYQMIIPKGKSDQIITAAEKCGVCLVIQREYGLPVLYHKYQKRYLSVLSLLIGILLIHWMSGRVWMIHIQGNQSQSADILFEFLRREGIDYGTSVKTSDCRDLTELLREEFPCFAWVSVRMEGVCLEISVKEGQTPESQKKSISGSPSDRTEDQTDILADEGGVIRSIYVRNGIACVQPGDTVKEGDLLVSGCIPVPADDDTISSYQYVCSDADIVLESEIEYRDKTSLIRKEKHYTGKEMNSILIELGPVRLGIRRKIKVSDYWDVIQKQYPMKLYEYFFLPVTRTVLTAREYEWMEKNLTSEEGTAVLVQNLQHFIRKLEEKGVQIFENNVKIECAEKCCIASGSIIIGKSSVRYCSPAGTAGHAEEE